MIPTRWPIYISSFTMLNCNNVNVLDIRPPKMPCAPEYVGRIRQADIVLMSGGNQSRLVDIF
jgi:cyanophycinase